MEKKFDPEKLDKLNDPQRLADIPPDYIAGQLSTAEPDIMVEIGAGTGLFSVAFLDRFDPTTVYACDISDVMIDWMTDNLSSEYLRIIPVKSEEHTVPLEDGVADVVYMINVYHELEHPLLSIDEFHRLLKPGGEILIVDWEKREMSEGPPTNIRCRPGNVAEQLTGSGFTDVSMSNELPKHFLVVGTRDG